MTKTVILYNADKLWITNLFEVAENKNTNLLYCENYEKLIQQLDSNQASAILFNMKSISDLTSLLYIQKNHKEIDVYLKAQGELNQIINIIKTNEFKTVQE